MDHRDQKHLRWRVFLVRSQRPYVGVRIIALLLLSIPGCATRVKEANELARQASDTAAQVEAYYAVLRMRSATFAELNAVGEIQGGTVADRLLADDLNPPTPPGESPDYLAAHLKKPASPVDAFFRQRLSAPTLEILDNQYDPTGAPPAGLNAAIIADLNQHMDEAGGRWYDALQTDLGTVQLSEEAQALIAQYTLVGSYTLFPIAPGSPEPITARQRRVTINRLILDSAYPRTIKPPLSARFQAQQIALRKREQMAHVLRTIGDALQNLTGTAASDKVKEAAAKLQQKIEEVNHHPLSISSSDPVIKKILASKQLNLDPPTLGARMFQLIAQIQQEREFRGVLPMVDAFLQTLRDFFDAEQPAYLSVSANYFVAVGKRDMTTIDDPTLAMVTADAKTLEPYGIRVEVHPQTGDNGKLSAKQQIEQATYAHITVARSEMQDVSNALEALHQAFQRFLVRSRLAPSGPPAYGSAPPTHAK